MAANKVGNQTACFTNQQFATGKIPRLQADLKETVNATSGNIGQIKRCRAGATEVCTLGKQLAKDRNISRCVLFNFEREAGRQNGAV